MAGQSRRRGLVAFGKQTAVGVPNTSPAWTVPITGGGIGIVREDDVIPVTALVSGRMGRYVQRARLEGSVRMLAHPKLLGFLLKHAMGAISTTGTGPYTHTFTMAEEYPSPGFTFYSLVGDDWLQAYDCFITSLSIRGESGGNVEVEVALGAKAAAVGVPAPTYTVTNVEPRFKFLGSTIKVDADSGSPQAVDNVEAFEVTIARDPDIRYGASLMPRVVAPDRLVDASATIAYDSDEQGWDFYRVAISGSTATPAAASQDMREGSFEITFGVHPSSANEMLRVASGTGATGAGMRNWSYSVTRPEADPAGGAITMDVAGPLLTDGSGTTELTVQLTNDAAGSTY